MGIALTGFEPRLRHWHCRRKWLYVCVFLCVTPFRTALGFGCRGCLIYVMFIYLFIFIYLIASCFIRQNHCHGGVLLYVVDGFQFNELNNAANFSEELHFECCAITFLLDNVKHCLISVYRPPTGSIEIFIHRLSHVLNYFCKTFTNIMLSGDININYLENSLHKQKKMLTDLLDSYKLHFKSREPTRMFTNKNGQTSISKIDYFITNISQDSYSEIIEDLNVGDHFALIIEFTQKKIKNKKCESRTNTFRAIDEYSLNRLDSNISEETFESVYACISNINDAYKEFLNCLLFYVDTTCPVITQNKGQRSNKAWITKEIIDMGRELKGLFWLYKQANMNKYLTNKYLLLKKTYRQKINLAKKSYNQKLLSTDNMVQKQKRVWNIVREKTGKIKPNMGPEIMVENNLISDEYLISNHFGEFFSVVAGEAVKKHFGANTSTECTTMNENSNSFFLHR